MSSTTRRYTPLSSVNCSSFPFYVLYIVEWAVRLLIYRSHRKAYYNISFEREAYRHGNDLSYLRCRRHHAWVREL